MQGTQENVEPHIARVPEVDQMDNVTALNVTPWITFAVSRHHGTRQVTQVFEVNLQWKLVLL